MVYFSLQGWNERCEDLVEMTWDSGRVWKMSVEALNQIFHFINEREDDLLTDPTWRKIWAFVCLFSLDSFMATCVAFALEIWYGLLLPIIFYSSSLGKWFTHENMWSAYQKLFSSNLFNSTLFCRMSVCL